MAMVSSSFREQQYQSDFTEAQSTRSLPPFLLLLQPWLSPHSGGWMHAWCPI